MAKPTRRSIFQKAAQKLRADFDELSTVPHNQIKGQEAERLIKAFLRGHLPKRFDIGSGFIIDPNDKLSKQTDIIIYDALNCPVYRASEEAAIFPSDNVAAVIEVKSRLNLKSFREAFENISATKSLAKTQTREHPFQYHRSQTLGCLFAFRTELTLPKLLEHYVKLIIEQGGFGRHIDLVALLDVGIITLAGSVPGMDGWNTTIIEGVPDVEGAHIGVAAYALRKDTLDGFLRILLVNLIPFRHIVAHPGFSWDKTESQGQGLLTYLTSTTTEKDPEKRKERLAAYRDQIAKEFLQQPVPKNWPERD